MNIITYPERTSWEELVQRPSEGLAEIEKNVDEIIGNVQKHGDKALFEYAGKFDHVIPDRLTITAEEIENAYASTDERLRDAMRLAVENIARFHAHQDQTVPVIETRPGVRCWQETRPIEKIGIYVPGGTAPLFSTLLMLAVPAKIAGCTSVVVCSPPDRNGGLHPSILCAAHLSGVTELFKVGGAQAVAAMAYGTETVPRVYKIFGPGNRYVTAAKQRVSLSGVAIDLPAGPSEVAVIADASAQPEFLAWDLLSQAEHGTDSQVIFVSDTKELLDKTRSALMKILETLPRKEIARESVKHSRMILIKDLEAGMDFINSYAPEHLIIHTANAADLAKRVMNAGSVFIGPWSPESAGDYASGTNHTLPTNAYARAYSGVTLDSFRKVITFQEITAEGLEIIGPAIERMAAEEGLEAHRQAVSVRLGRKANGD